MRYVIFSVLFLLFASNIWGQSFVEEDWGGVPARTKSKWSAVGLSLLYPGTGHLYLGDKYRSVPFLVAEGLTDVVIIVFAVKGYWQEQEYRWFAARYAGVNPEGKDDEYFRIIGKYQNMWQYNYITLLFERDRALLYPPEFDWNWRSDEDRLKYRGIWESSNRAWRNWKISLGIAIANRIISAIDVLRSAGKSRSFSFQISLLNSADGSSTGIQASLIYKP